MTDKMAGGAQDTPAIGFSATEENKDSLAERIRAKVTKSSDRLPKVKKDSNKLMPAQKSEPVNKRPVKKTVKDIPAVDGVQTRRMRLDRNTSYGMKVQRPQAELESGAYKMVSAPSQDMPVKPDMAPKLICELCGAVSEEKRLTCPECGNYFERTVNDTSFELEKARVRKTRETFAIEEEDTLTWKQMLARRITAKAIDFVIVFSGLAVISASYFGYAGRVLEETPELAPLFGNMTYWVLPALALLACLIYSASFEASLGQATPGKIAMGVVVSDKEGKQISFSRAFVRAFVTCSPLILMVVAVWFTKLFNPGLENISMESFWQLSQALAVAGGLGLIMYCVSFLQMAQDRGMRALSDHITGTIIAER